MLDRKRLLAALLLLFVSCIGLAVAQDQTAPAATTRAAAIPRLIKFGGVIRNAQGVVGVTFALYKDQTGGAPLWLESQNVELDANGHFTIYLGANHANGVPMALFTTGQARWLGVQADGQQEQARVLLVSVPYAVAAGNADMLGGLPASAYQLAVKNATAVGDYVNTSVVAQAAYAITNPVVNSIGKFTSTAGDMTSTNLYENNGKLGIGTSSPVRALHIKDANPNIRLEDTSLPNSFWELQQSAYNVDWFGFLRYENNVALPNKSLIITNDGRFGLGINSAYSDLVDKVVIGPGNLRLMGTPGTNGIVFPDGTRQYSAATSTGLTAGAGIAVTGTAPSFTVAVDNTVVRTGGSPSLAGATLTGTLNGTAAGFTSSSATATVSATQNGAGVSSVTTSAMPPAGVLGTSTASTANVAGVLGTSINSPDGAGVVGINKALTPNGSSSSATGVWGISFNAINGVGVFGEADENTNTNDANGYPVGVYGYAKSTIGVGVGGVDDASTGKTTGVWGGVDSTDGFGVEGDAYSTTGTAVGVAGFSDADSGKGVVGYATNTTGATVGVRGNVVSPGGVAGLFENTGGGDILIGRNAIGSTNVFRVENSGIVHGANFLTTGADFAESFQVRGPKAQYEAGDLLAIDEHSNRSLALTHEAYSTLVAGVYSTKPGMLASPYAVSDHGKLTDEVPLAVVGVVPLKVTAENGAIQRGDLLVSSSRPGYAMKGTDRSKMVGAVVGKALEPLPNGDGVIQVLVTLQ